MSKKDRPISKQDRFFLDMKVFYISEAAKMMGVSTKTLRRRDAEGVFCPEARSPGGRRVYTERQIIAFLNPTVAKKKEIIVYEPVPTKVGPSEEARRYAAEHKRQIRDMVVGNILTRSSQTRANRRKDREERLVDGDKVLKYGDPGWKGSAAWKWDRPPSLQEAQEAAQELQEAEDTFSAIYGRPHLKSLLRAWDEPVGEPGVLSLNNDHYPPLGLMIARGRGVRAAELRWWYRERVQTWPERVWGSEGYQAAWAEIYLRWAYAWRLRDLIKRLRPVKHS